MTLVAFVLFYIGLIVRFTYANSEEEFVAARFVSLVQYKVFLSVFLKVKLYKVKNDRL